MHRAVFGLIIFIVLASCGDNSSPPTGATPPPPGGWTFQFSPGMSAPNPYGNGGFSFSFPTTDGVHYLVKGHTGPLSSVIAMTYTIDAPLSAVFNSSCGAGYPGMVTAYFHVATDASFVGEFARWFATGYSQELKAGNFTLGAPLSDPAKWQSVQGKNGMDAFSSWQWATANVGEVGVVFGNPSCGGTGHGVFVTGGAAAMAASSFGAN